MALVTSQGYQLTPDVSPLVQQLTQALGQRRETQRQEDIIARKEKIARDEIEAEKLRQDFKTTGDQFLRVNNLPTFDGQRKEIAILGQEAFHRGEDTTLYTDALNITNPDELNMFLERVATAAGNADKVISQGIAQQKAQAKADEPVEASQVQSSEFLPGGGVRIIRKDGSVEVVQPTEEEVAIIKSGEDRGVDLQQRRAKGRVLGTGTAKIANTALDRTEKIRENNLKLKKVIAEVRGGAETGPLANMLPSFRASTRRLIQIKNELGLDVVGSVTFGALSEGELRLAMDTALPTTLDGPELIKWAQEKISAQEKLAEYLEDQAIFLSGQGNTAADWLARVRAKRVQSDEPIPDAQPAQAPISTETSTVGRFTIEVIE